MPSNELTALYPICDVFYIQAGDVILLDESISDDWLRGHTTGASAMFPSNFVDVIEAPPKAANPVSRVNQGSTYPIYFYLHNLQNETFSQKTDSIKFKIELCLRPTCLTASFTCPGLLVNGLWLALGCCAI